MRAKRNLKKNLKKLDPNIARVIFKAGTIMFDIKVNYKRKYKFNLDCPFCKYYDEIFDHIFKCNSGSFLTRCLHATELVGFCSQSQRFGKLEFFLKNIPNIEKKCYSPVVSGFWCICCFRWC